MPSDAEVELREWHSLLDKHPLAEKLAQKAKSLSPHDTAIKATFQRFRVWTETSGALRRRIIRHLLGGTHSVPPVGQQSRDEQQTAVGSVSELLAEASRLGQEYWDLQQALDTRVRQIRHSGGRGSTSKSKPTQKRRGDSSSVEAEPTMTRERTKRSRRESPIPESPPTTSRKFVKRSSTNSHITEADTPCEKCTEFNIPCELDNSKRSQRCLECILRRRGCSFVQHGSSTKSKPAQPRNKSPSCQTADQTNRASEEDAAMEVDELLEDRGESEDEDEENPKPEDGANVRGLTPDTEAVVQAYIKREVKNAGKRLQRRFDKQLNEALKDARKTQPTRPRGRPRLIPQSENQPSEVQPSSTHSTRSTGRKRPRRR